MAVFDPSMILADSHETFLKKNEARQELAHLLRQLIYKLLD